MPSITSYLMKSPKMLFASVMRGGLMYVITEYVGQMNLVNLTVIMRGRLLGAYIAYLMMVIKLPQKCLSLEVMTTMHSGIIL